MGFEQIVYVPQVSRGANPGTGYLRFPHRSFDYGAQDRFVQDEENKPNLTPQGSVLIATQNGGGIDFHLRLANHLIGLFPGLFLSTWSTPLAISGSISAAASDNSFNSTGLFTAVQEGQWIQVGGLHSSVNGKHLVIDKPSNDKIIVATDITGDQAGSGDETIIGSRIRRGGSGWSAVETVYAIEKQFLAGSLNGSDTRYKLSLDNFVAGLNLGAQVENLLRGRVTFLGQVEGSSGSSGAGTPSDPSAGEILGPITGVRSFWEGTFAARTSYRMNEVVWDFQNPIEPIRDLLAGTVGISDVEHAPPSVSFTTRPYRKSPSIFTLLDKRGTLSKAAVEYADPAGNSLIITLPQTRIETDSVGVSGARGVRSDQVRMVAEEDTDSTSPFYGVGVQADWFPA